MRHLVGDDQSIRSNDEILASRLHQEWALGLDEAIDAESEAQALCMQTQDFRRAYTAFITKQKPQFEGA